MRSVSTPDLRATESHEKRAKSLSDTCMGPLAVMASLDLSPEARKQVHLITEKKSPVSVFNFPRDDVEEMKVSFDDAFAYVQLVAPPVLAAHPPRDDGQEMCHDDVASYDQASCASPDTDATSDKPPLRPVMGSRSNSESSLTYCSETPIQDGDSGELALLKLADDCLATRDTETALSLYKSLFRELDKKYGREHPQVALCIHKIGEAHLLSGNFERSVTYLEAVISLRSILLGPRNVDVATSIEMLATAKLHLNEVDQAHSAYRRALRIKRSRLGLYHEDVAHIQFQLGCIYYYARDYEGAEAAFQVALDVYRRLSILGSGDRIMWTLKAADASCSIGTLKLHQGKYYDAAKLFAEALEAQKQVHGIYDPIVITTLDNLGFANAKNNSLVVAAEIYEEMLLAQTTYHGAYTIECYETLKKLNIIYERSGKLFAAYDTTLEAVKIQKRCLSPDHVVFKKTIRLLKRLEEKLSEE